MEKRWKLEKNDSKFRWHNGWGCRKNTFCEKTNKEKNTFSLNWWCKKIMTSKRQKIVDQMLQREQSMASIVEWTSFGEDLHVSQMNLSCQMIILQACMCYRLQVRGASNVVNKCRECLAWKANHLVESNTYTDCRVITLSRNTHLE